MAIQNGRIIGLECQGDQDGPRFLDGRTGDGTVGLAPITGGEFTGTRWQVSSVQEIDSNSVIATVRCMGDTDGPRFLDGRTGDGTVGLAPETGGGFTGTRWLIQDFGDYILTLECQGNVPGNKFLDGRVGDGTVGLAPEAGGVFTGTRWKITFV